MGDHRRRLFFRWSWVGRRLCFGWVSGVENVGKSVVRERNFLAGAGFAPMTARAIPRLTS